MIDFVITGVAAVAAAYLIVLVASAQLPSVSRLAFELLDELSSPLNINLNHAAGDRRRRRLRKDIDAELGRTDRWRDPDIEILAAAYHAQTITAVDGKLRMAVRRCYARHWELASALRCESMSPIATHPVVQAGRVQLIDLSGILVEEIESYPLLESAPELLVLGVAAGRLGSCCALCPYFSSSVREAPRPCPSLSAISAANADSRVHEGEILE